MDLLLITAYLNYNRKLASVHGSTHICVLIFFLVFIWRNAVLFCFFFLIAASYITSGWPLLNMNLLRHLPRESLRRKLERGVKWCDIVHVDYKRQRGFREVVADGEWERGILLQKVGQIWGSAMRELWLLKDKESWRVGEWVIFGNSVEAFTSF